MRRLVHVFVPGALAALMGVTLAQTPPPRQQKYVYHYEWTKGARLTGAEWGRGREIDHPRAHHLPPAPRGSAWREIDGNYVLVSKATHAIDRVVAAPH